MRALRRAWAGKLYKTSPLWCKVVHLGFKFNAAEYSFWRVAALSKQVGSNKTSLKLEYVRIWLKVSVRETQNSPISWPTPNHKNWCSRILWVEKCRYDIKTAKKPYSELLWWLWHSKTVGDPALHSLNWWREGRQRLVVIVRDWLSHLPVVHTKRDRGLGVINVICWKTDLFQVPCLIRVSVLLAGRTNLYPSLLT